MEPLDPRQRALVELGRALRDGGYRFVTPTPETHRRVNARAGNAEARTLRDVFGWSRPFRRETLPPALLHLCEAAGILAPAAVTGDATVEDAAGDAARSNPEGTLFTSTVRYSTLASPSAPAGSPSSGWSSRAGSAAEGELILVHSAYPTTGADAVFFGPDSYRFAALLARAVWKARRLVDVGCGTGVGGLTLAARADEVVLADINPAALRLAAVNRALARRDGGAVSLCASDVLAQVEGELDVVVANPPYLVDGPGRTYRDGGGPLGLELAARIVTESLRRLTPGGLLVLYSGTPIVDGTAVLPAELAPLLQMQAASFQWEELDPDVFGEELERPAYQTTDRLAVLALIATAAG
jgi:SAM-dependent methyltransferase